jgi:hypothetical protein
LPLVLELTSSASHRKWGIIYIAAVLAAENSFFFGVYQGIPLGDISTFVILAMILPVLLEQAKAFLLDMAALLHAPASAAASQEN